MTNITTSRKLARRSLSLVVCYTLALQAFLTAYGTAFAISRADVETPFAICHGAGDPSSGDSQKSEKAPCALCAVAAAAGGLLNDPATVAAAPLVVCGLVDLTEQTTSASIPDARAGLSRAPPLPA